ncbi:tetratricopeptide repeat protein [Nonomuraea sp. NBC_00507]|uniref:AfsR/SARP family transcriptional regulator n=1 Tax=Nonomuraea sp. NBC_00507 TaxID=2976002 RepID=UPI002E188DA1
MEFRVLGPVEIWRDGGAVPIVGEKQRTLIALLVLRANHVVPHDHLLEALWGDDRPAAGRRALHNHLWSLRRLLTKEGEISTSPGGYSLRVSATASDLAVFHAEVAAANAARAANDLPRAAERLHAALDLWRGPALTGTRPEFQTTEGHALEELRFAALTDRIEADLALGRHAELIGELRQLTSTAPLRERFRSQLMVALYRDGRRADALEQYRLARQCFRDELGLEPSDELQRLHQAILSADPDLFRLNDPVRPVEARPPRPKLVPRQLPTDVARFTGRDEHLDTLNALLIANPAKALVISAIAGAGGVGKTALATHWGHLRADQFPDGQLYVNLHGYSRNAPVTATQALRQLLRGLGIPLEEIPHETDERAAMYRSAVADKRLLIVLDNAATAEQVRPLLPGSSASRVLITSRDSLRSLAVTHEVDIVQLDVLSPEEAQALLFALLSDEQDKESIGELAALCGYLPLALRLAAAQVHGEREPAADLVARLREGSRLRTLDLVEDPHIGVRSAFALSYQTLPELARSAFRIASLHPGRDVSLGALAAMLGESLETTRQAVDMLVRAHLAHSSNQRVTMHDLIREYARELADTEGERREAWTRLLGWHTHTARAAMSYVDPDGRLMHPSVPGPAGGVQEFADQESAQAWLNSEFHNTVALITHAASNGLPIHSWELAYITAYHFYLTRRIDDWITVQRAALEAVRQVGDLNGEAKILTTLGHALIEVDLYGEFLVCQRRAVELAVATKDKRMHAEAQYYVAFGLFRTGGLGDALDANAQARDLYREIDDWPGELAAIYLAGQINVKLGRMQRALEDLDIALAYCQERGRRHDEADILFYVGMANVGLGHLTSALENFALALRIARELEDRTLEAQALCHLGEVELKQGRFPEALRLQEEAFDLAQQVPGRLTECRVRNGLGRTYAMCGNHSKAREFFGAALEIAEKINDPYELAAAQSGLAQALAERELQA